MKKRAQVSKTVELRRNEAKWSLELMQAGWTAIPSVILEYQHKLGLDAVDVNILLQLASHWWDAERLPYPSKRTLATRLDVDPSTIQRHIRKLEQAGLIERIPRHHPTRGQSSNEHSFTGLIERAKHYAAEKLQEREAREAKRSRKGLRVISGGKDTA